MNVILGAGLSGLICAALNAKAQVYERNDSSFVGHRAVLRFRDDKIARALGLSFRRVTVHKAIWLDGQEIAPSPRVANFYSMKVRGIIASNSIWNLAPSERFIAPDNLHALLADICIGRVHWNTSIDAAMLSELLEQSPIVSTIPLPLLLDLLPVNKIPLPFRYSPITVDRYRVADCDVFQTIYFPDPTMTVYRATLTGDLLTIESAGSNLEFEKVLSAFGLRDAEPIESSHKQSFGKIAPVPDYERKALLHRLTREFGIYSLGRFATWRNILLDDVYDDIFSIRKMMTLHSYDSTLERTKE